MRKSPWLVIPALLLVLTAAACSDGDDDDDAKTEDSSSGSSDASKDDYANALAADMDESGNAFADTETNKCVAGALVEGIGLDNLREKVTPEELAAADTLEEQGLEIDSDAVWDKANECADIGLWLMTATAGGDETAGACLVDATTEEQRKAYFVAGLEGTTTIDPEVETALNAAMAQCAPTDTTDTTTG